MTALLLIGAGGHGRVIADLAELLGFDRIAFADDNWPDLKANRHWPVVGARAELPKLRLEFDAAVAVTGDNALRVEIHRDLVRLGYETPTLVHPSAVVSRHAALGRGTTICGQAFVGSFTIIGEAAIINTAATIDHDCTLAEGAHLSPGAHVAGGVRIGARSWIGVGAAVRQGISIGDDVTVGAGAAVAADIPDRTTAVGVPARPVMSRQA